MCGDKKAPYTIWPDKDAKFQALLPTRHEMYFLCPDCNKAAEEGTLPTSEDALFDFDWENYGTLPPTVIAPNNGPTQGGTPVIPKCVKHHFDAIEGPEGYGILRASSSRGGMEIDTDADYALFFDRAWDRMRDPLVEAWQPGNKPAPPILDEEDLSDWPGALFVEWADYSGPTSTVLKYAEWTAQQWAEGKSIQFGCVGGHGRTGTFLALVLLNAGMAITDEEVIKWVHENYCKDAIESTGQKTAIKALADRLAKA